MKGKPTFAASGALLLAVAGGICWAGAARPARAEEAKPAASTASPGAGAQPAGTKATAPEVVVYASELPEDALSEFEFWKNAGSPGGRMVGTPNNGDKVNPPPEEDPHVKLQVRVQRDVPYRCWIHMWVGPPLGVSLANRLWVQFSDAVDASGKSTLEPGTGSYLTAQGPTRRGWAWVACDAASTARGASLVRFRTGGEVTVRIQVGMEGVGFDQVLLSPARYLERPPSEAVVKK